MPNTVSLSWSQRLTRSVALAAQHVDQVHGAEALAGAVDRRQRLAARRRWRPRSPAARGRCRSCRRARSPRRNSRAGARAGSPRSRTGRAARRAWRATTRLYSSLAFGLVDHAPLLHHVGQAVGHPRIGGQRRRGRRGRSPGNSPRCSSAGRGARRSARRACRCPCRTRWSRPSRCRPRAGSAPGVAARVGAVHAGVIGQRVDALASTSHAAVSSTLRARQAIDDAGLAGVLVADEAQQLRARRRPSRRCV